MSRIYSRRAQQGISMIEILIAILVLAVGALGFAGVQVVAMQKSENANYRSSAMLIAQDAVERIQANTEALDEYLAADPIEIPETTPQQACTGDCSISALDRSQLAWTVDRNLPNGLIKIDDCEFNGMTCVVLNWGERAGEGNDIADCTSNDGINLSDDANCLVMEFSR